MFDPCKCCLEWRCSDTCSYYVQLGLDDDEDTYEEDDDEPD